MTGPDSVTTEEARLGWRHVTLLALFSGSLLLWNAAGARTLTFHDAVERARGCLSRVTPTAA